MAGILKFKSTKPTTQHLAIPQGEGWELWAFTTPAAGRCLKKITAEGLSSLPPETRIALPVRQLLSVPLWLQTTDTTLFSGMIALQLEKRGFCKSEEAVGHFHYEIVKQESARVLVHVLMLATPLPENLCQTSTGDYDYSARCRPVAADGLTLWREEGRLVVVATCGGKVVHVQALTASEINAESSRELFCLYLQLSWEGVIVEAPQVTLLGVFSPEEQAAGAQFFPEILVQPLPSPLWPSASFTLMPQAVRAARQQVGQRNRWRRLLQQLGGAYLIALVGLLIYVGWLAWQVQQQRGQLQASAATVQQLSQASDRWRALQIAIDPTFYPMEALLSCVQALPPEVRLTQFEHNAGKILLMGESRDAASAFKYLGQIQADTFLKKWSWNMPQPQLLPSNRAQFQMEGTRALAPTH